MYIQVITLCTLVALMHVLAQVSGHYPTANVQLIRQTITNKLQDIVKQRRKPDRQPPAAKADAVYQGGIEAGSEDNF